MWSMGLIHADDWTAQWIEMDRGDETVPDGVTRTRLLSDGTLFAVGYR
jgi:hypothetical protein